MKTSIKGIPAFAKRGLFRFAALALGLGLVSTGWATVPVPTAVWETGEFEDAANLHGGYSISLNGNTVNSDGNIVIGDSSGAGATIAITDVVSGGASSMTVLYKYKTVGSSGGAKFFVSTYLRNSAGTAGEDIGAICWSDTNYKWVFAAQLSSGAWKNWRDSGWGSGSAHDNALSTSGGYVLFAFQTADKARAYTGSSLDSLAGFYKDGTTYSSSTYNGTMSHIGIGGPTGLATGTDYYGQWPGIVIEKVAIFIGNVYTDEDIAGYRWPSEIKAVLPERDMININISNEDGYAITGGGVETISTLAGEMLDNAWQNTKGGTKSHSGSGTRNAYLTGVTAYDASTKSATVLSDVKFAWAVEANDVSNYGNQAIDNNPTYHKAWLARATGAGGTPSILVQAIPYKKYDVIVYCFGSDDDPFDPITVNGTQYVGDTTLDTDTKTRKASASSEKWGGRRAMPSLGQTAIRVNGIENPELSITTVGGKHSFCAVQIVRDMSEGVWPTAKKVISLNLMSAYSDSGTTPAVYGLEPVPDAAWTKDGLGSISSSGTDVSATIMEWDGSSAVEASGVTVNEKANNAYGWSGYNYTPQNQMLSGYLDDGGSRATVTVTGVPYAVYDVIVYMATDTEDRQFGPVKVNDVPYRWDDGSGEAVVADSADSAAATRWGASRSRLPAYGLNAIRIPSQISSTLTIVGANNANSARGCIAAIQIVEAYSGLKVYSNGSWSGDGTEPTSGDAIIVVDGDTSLSIDGTASLDTVTITGTGTLTLGGSGTFTVDVLEIAQNSHIVMNESRLSATAVIGEGTAIYDNAVPATGKGWTDSAKWKGTVQVRNVTNMVGDSRAGVWLKFNDYGNSGSVVELNNVTGWFEPAYNCTVPLKITGTLTINNGNSGKNNAFKVGTLLGSGTIDGSGSAPFMVFQILNDWSGFTGAVQLSTSKVVAFGSEVPSTVADDNNDAGTIYIAAGAEVEIKSSSLWWAAGVGFVVDGTLKAESRDKWGGGTAITLGDTGVLNISSTGNLDSRSKNFSNVTGTGTVRFSGSGWATLPDGANMFADTLSVELEQASGVVCGADTTKTIGSIFGTKNLRSDMDGSGKTLIVKQAKDGVWSGSFHGGNDRLEKMVVQGGASSTGTLTLAGTTTADGGNTYNDKLEVASSGSVKLTGQWIGDTTVAGTFGGTGTLDGALTFSDGATFKANATALTVTGAVAFPEGADDEVIVDMTGVTPSSDGTTLISSSTSMGSATKLTASGAVLKVVGNDLKAYPVVATYGGENYATFEEAITAALADEGGEANLASITVVDATAELPVGYHISNNVVVKYPVAVMKNGSYLATGYTDTILAAIQAIYVADYNGVYDYIEIVSGSSFVIPYGSLGDGVLKIKNTANATPIPDGLADDCMVDANEPQGEVYTEYSKSNKPTTYTWVGGVEDTYYPGSYMWAEKGNWRYVNSSSETVTASRQPQAGDSVVFNAAANVTVADNTTIDSITNSAAITLTKSTADVTVTATTGGIVLTDAGASITVTGVALSPTPTTTVANSYAKLTGSTYSVDAYNVIMVSAPNATVTRTDALGTAIKDGDTITFTVAAGSGYVVSGVTANEEAVVPDAGVYSVTVTENTTIAVATVQNASISDVTFDYYASYTNADVTATVGGAGVYTLSVQGKEYVANAESAGTITFQNVDVSNTELGSGVAYEITASGAATGGTSGTSEQKKGTVVDGSGWMLYNKTATGVGSWTDGDGAAVMPDYGDNDYASFSGTNIYAATGVSTGDVVTVSTIVAFGGAADPAAAVDPEAQAALRINAGESGNTFQVYAAGPAWVDAGNDDLGAPEDEQRYTVTLRIDYGIQKFYVTIGKDETVYSLTNAAGVSGFDLAKGASGMRQVQYNGSGSFVSIEGANLLTGYMADVGTEGNVTNVAVSADFVSEYLAGEKASAVPALISPTAERTCDNGLNYFESYALGLNPTSENDAPIVNAAPTSDGKIALSLTKANGDAIRSAGNVDVDVAIKEGESGVSGESESGEGVAKTIVIDPASLGTGVHRFKAEIGIGAK